jgi:hypothetical protein
MADVEELRKVASSANHLMRAGEQIFRVRIDIEGNLSHSIGEYVVQRCESERHHFWLSEVNSNKHEHPKIFRKLVLKVSSWCPAASTTLNPFRPRLVYSSRAAFVFAVSGLAYVLGCAAFRAVF